MEEVKMEMAMDMEMHMERVICKVPKASCELTLA